MFDNWDPPLDTTLALRLLKLTIAGLNFMFYSGRAGPVPKVATALHRHVFRRIQGKLDCALSDLVDVDRDVCIEGSLV